MEIVCEVDSFYLLVPPKMGAEGVLSKHNRSAKVHGDAVLKVCQKLIEHNVEFAFSMNKTTNYGEFVVNKGNYNILTTILSIHVVKPKQNILVT